MQLTHPRVTLLTHPHRAPMRTLWRHAWAEVSAGLGPLWADGHPCVTSFLARPAPGGGTGGGRQPPWRAEAWGQGGRATVALRLNTPLLCRGLGSG